MPQFFIHVENGFGFMEDQEGLQCPSLGHAKIAAINAAADLIADELKGGKAQVRATFYIEDEQHRPVLNLPVVATIG